MTTEPKVVCAHCDKAHGIVRTREENVSHGICARHRRQFVEEMHLSPVEEAILLHKMEDQPAAPDLGPVTW